MCGIIGVKIKILNNDVKENLFYIYSKQEHRGRIGCGVALNRNGNLSRLRGKEASDLFTHQDFLEFWRGIQQDDIVMVHHRNACSGGNGYCDESNHPIANEDQSVMLIHNGWISGYKEIHKKLFKQGHVFETEIITSTKNGKILDNDITDTEVLVHLLEGNNVVENIDKIKDLDGAIAIAFFKKNNPSLYLYRKNTPIIVYKDGYGNIYFSSEFHNDGRFTRISALKEGILYSLNKKLNWIRRVKEFKREFYTRDNYKDKTKQKILTDLTANPYNYENIGSLDDDDADFFNWLAMKKEK